NTYQGAPWKVVSASAIEYSEDWRFYCQLAQIDIIDEVRGGYLDFSGLLNPYKFNYLGNFRAQKSYAYLTGRNHTEESYTRHSGFYKSFNPFYKHTESTWVKDDTDWTFANGVSIYYPHGMEAENKDALNRFSSAQYGYNYTL